MPEFTSAIARDNWEKHGERPSNLDWGGASDATRLTDGAITAFDNTFTSASNPFTPSDVGKTICILGAGGGGYPLTTTIASFTSAGSVELTAAALITVSGAWAIFGTDNTTAITNAIQKATADGFALVIPGGAYLVTGQITMKDLAGFTVTGHGGATVIYPVSSLANNLFDCSGGLDGEFSHFTIDGVFLRKSSLMLSALYGDGTPARSTYGNIRVRGLRIRGWEQQGIGIGANVGYTVEDIEIIDNHFDTCGVGWKNGTFGGGPIDTGSGGTKRRFKVMRNKIRFAANTFGTDLQTDAIFCGHGWNYDFLVCDNQIFDASGHGIQLHNRPFASEAHCVFEGAIVKGNLIRNAGTAAIGNLGASQCSITNNTCINPNTSSYNHAPYAISISHGIDGISGSYLAVLDLHIQGNILTDTRGGSATMDYGINVDSSTTAAGVIDNNLVSGYKQGPVQFVNNAANFTTKYQTSTRDVQSFSNSWTQYGSNLSTKVNQTNSLGTALIQKSTNSFGGFKVGLGMNCEFDGANWVTGTDGGSNGGAVIIAEYGGSHPNIEMYTIPSTGTTPQTISSLSNYKRQTLNDQDLQAFVSKLGIFGTAGTQTDLAIRKNTTVSGSNVEFRISHRSNNADLYIYSDNATTTTNWLKMLTASGILESEKKFKAPDLQATNLANAALVQASSDGTLQAVGNGTDLIVYAANIGAAQSVANPVGAWLIERSIAALAGYVIGVGLNVRFDGSNWKLETDGSSNGGAAITCSYGDGVMHFYTVGSTGGTTQSISNSTFTSNKEAGTIDTSGKMTMKSFLAQNLTANQPVMADGSKNMVSTKVDPANANHVNTANLTDGQFIKRSGTALASDKVDPANSSHVNTANLTDGQFIKRSGTAFASSKVDPHNSSHIDTSNLTDLKLLRRNGSLIESLPDTSDLVLTPASGAGVNIGSTNNGSNNVGIWLVERSASSGGGYLVCLGLNCRYDGSNWVTGTDGGSNAAAVIAVNYGDGNIQFYVIPSTGGTVQTITNANLINYRVGYIEGNGKMTMTNLRATAQTTAGPARFNSNGDVINGKMNLNAAGDVDVTGFTDGALLKRNGTSFASATFAASSLMKTNGSGVPGTGKCDLGNQNDVDGTGMSAGQYLRWDGLKAVGISPATLAADLYTTLDARYANKSAYDAHVHSVSVPDHSHGGVQPGVGSTVSGGGSTFNSGGPS